MARQSLCLLGFLLLLPLSLAAITIDGYSAATNDRFVNDAAFLLAEQNLSAIGRSSDNR